MRHEILRFLVVGGGAALLDGCVYLLLVTLGLDVRFAKGVSFALAAAAAYLGNKHFTFQREAGSWTKILLYCALYASTLGLNVLINSAVLQVLGGTDRISLVTAWAFATFASATVNFVATKLLIFRGANLA